MQSRPGIRAAQQEAGRVGEDVHVFGDMLVFLGHDTTTAMIFAGAPEGGGIEAPASNRR